MDATVYVGVDDNITVTNNKLTNGMIGIELENTTNSFVSGNKLTNNVTGILVVVLPGLPTTATEHAVIERNVIRANNLPTPSHPHRRSSTTCSSSPREAGVLNVGGDDITMRRNVITHNDSFGIGIVDNPFGFGPPDENRVVSNTVMKNGGDPDPRRSSATSATTKRGRCCRQRLRLGRPARWLALTTLPLISGPPIPTARRLAGASRSS